MQISNITDPHSVSWGKHPSRNYCTLACNTCILLAKYGGHPLRCELFPKTDPCLPGIQLALGHKRLHSCHGLCPSVADAGESGRGLDAMLRGSIRRELYPRQHHWSDWHNTTKRNAGLVQHRSLRFEEVPHYTPCRFLVGIIRNVWRRIIANVPPRRQHL